MNFILTIIAVTLGLYLYNFIEGIRNHTKSGKEHKQLLRWKNECEDNISAGKNVEENKSHLKVVEKSLEEFYKKHIN